MVTGCTLSAPALADDAAFVNHRPPGWECRWCPEPPVTSGDASAGAGYVSDSSFKFGQYNGLEDEGGYVLGNVEGHYRGDDAAYADVTGSQLGLRSRRVEIAGGKQGEYSGYARYDQLPRLETDSARTPFNGRGDDTLTLPVDWVAAGDSGDMSALEDSLRGIEIKQERKRFEAGFSVMPFSRWTFSGRFSHETKEGTKTIGGAIGSNFGAATATILPEPVDYKTDEVELRASYAARGLQAEVGYYGSFFNDENRSLTWQNPFADPADADGFGRLALPPDNRSHQVFGSVGYDLMEHTRLTGNLAFGRMTQDERFLPFTVNPELQRPLPRPSADAEVDTRLVNLKLRSRPLDRLRLGAEYEFNERDNDTPQDLYDYVVADAAAARVARTNLPYGFEQNLFRLDAGYTLPKRTDLSIGYEHDRLERSFQEAEKTKENTLWARLKSRPHERIDLRLGYEHADRDYDAYAPVPEIQPPQNPLMRKFYMADRDRNKATAAVTARLGRAWSLGVTADYNKDDYSHSAVGLQDAKDAGVTFDVSFTPGPGLSAHAFYTRQRIKSTQTGSQSFAAPDWSTKTTDTFNNLGAGLRWMMLADRLEIVADYVYAASEGDIEVTSDRAAAAPLPDFETRRHTFSVYGTYRLKEDLDLRLGYLYERYRSDDWTLDGVTPTTIPNVLNMGVDSPDYSVSVYTAGLRFKF
jgi:MtrB/PioB family decaheme-associated outer membrane protein